MNSYLALISFSLVLLTQVLTAREKEIPVYLEPDSSSSQVASIDPDQFHLIEYFPVLDEAKAREGWLFAEYDGTFVGFVDPGTVTKGLNIQSNTPVYLRPDSGSPVLALIQEGDSVEIKQVGTDWVEIEFQKRVPVYFKDPDFEDPDAPEEETEPATPPQPERGERTLRNEDSREEPIPVEPLTREEDRRQGENETGNTEVLEAIETPPAPRVAPGLSPNRDTPTQAPSGSPAYDTPRYIEGKLVRATRLFGFKPRYRYELKSAGGKHMAWVDLSNVLVQSLAPYMDKQVRIYGEIRPLKANDDLIVFARTIRLR